jgi:hypothetical protein
MGGPTSDRRKNCDFLRKFPYSQGDLRCANVKPRPLLNPTLPILSVGITPRMRKCGLTLPARSGGKSHGISGTV